MRLLCWFGWHDWQTVFKGVRGCRRCPQEQSLSRRHGWRNLPRSQSFRGLKPRRW